MELFGSTESSKHDQSNDIQALCERARAGCPEALGELLDGCRRYLLLVANQELGSDLQMKAGPSDLVQETLLEAQRDFAQFDGTNEKQLLAWLRQVLLHNLTNFRRRYLHTAQRQIRREVPLTQLQQDHQHELLAIVDTPSAQAIRSEEAELLEQALAQLPESYQRVIVLRHRDNMTFARIGELTNRSADAARMLWWRAFERLTKQVNSQL